MKNNLYLCNIGTLSLTVYKISNCLGESSDEDDNDQDTLKETLLETNAYLLGLTIIVSILHSVFEFLAFKNGKFVNCIYSHS